MADRLTPEREAEIRAAWTTAEPWDEEPGWRYAEADVRSLLAELDAVRAERDSERAARLAAERQVHRLIHGQEIEGDRLCSHELEAIPLRDRVRELEAERAALRAQLATLREAWRRYDRSCAPTAMQDPDARAAWDRAIAALAEPGPTLASIEAAALRRAAGEMGDEPAMFQSEWGDGWDTGWDEAANWLRARADELEGQR